MDKKVIEQFSRVVDRLGSIAERLENCAQAHKFNSLNKAVDNLSAKVKDALEEKVY